MTGVYPDISSRIGVDHYTHQAPLRTQPSNRSSLCSEFMDDDFELSLAAKEEVQIVDRKVWSSSHQKHPNQNPNPTIVAKTQFAIPENKTRAVERMDETASTNTNTRKTAGLTAAETAKSSPNSRDEVKSASVSQRPPKSISQDAAKFSERENSLPKTPQKAIKDLRSDSIDTFKPETLQFKDQGFEDQSMFFGSVGSFSNQKNNRKLQFEHGLEQISAIKKPDAQSPVESLADVDESFDTDSDLKQLHKYLSGLSGQKLPPFPVTKGLKNHKTINFNDKDKSPISIIPEAKYSYEERSEADFKKTPTSKSDARDRSDHVTNLGRIDEDSDNELGESRLDVEWNPLRFDQNGELEVNFAQLNEKESPKPAKWGNLDEEPPMPTNKAASQKPTTIVPESTTESHVSPSTKKLKIVGIKKQPPVTEIPQQISAFQPKKLRRQSTSTSPEPAHSQPQLSPTRHGTHPAPASPEDPSAPHSAPIAPTANSLAAKQKAVVPSPSSSRALAVPVDGALVAERASPQGPITLRPAGELPGRAAVIKGFLAQMPPGSSITKGPPAPKRDVYASSTRDATRTPLIGKQDLLTLFSRKRVQTVLQPLVGDTNTAIAHNFSTRNALSGAGLGIGKQTNGSKRTDDQDEYMGPSRSYTQELQRRWGLGRGLD